MIKTMLLRVNTMFNRCQKACHVSYQQSMSTFGVDVCSKLAEINVQL